MDFGGLQVRQVTTFTKVFAVTSGAGATFFEPAPLPDGFSMLGGYAQPNDRALYGFVLVARDSAGGALEPPIDYTLVLNETGSGGFIWEPTPPEGYKAVGHIATSSPSKPALGKVRCVREDLTDACETHDPIWADDSAGVLVYGVRPTNRTTNSHGVATGTFAVVKSGSSATALGCLKNNNFDGAVSSSMPNMNQIQAIVDAYAPVVYLHPKEQYLPSSVKWFFSNGALLVTKGNESNPVRVDPDGSNLPQGGTNDGAYWLDLPADGGAREVVKKGNLSSAEAYIHVKPMIGATVTDVAAWVFYPFNGAVRAKVGIIKELSLGKTGEHVGDWEHVTLRISNFDGSLRAAFYSQHSSGQWLTPPQLEFADVAGRNKLAAYSSHNGHAFYPKAGTVLQGSGDIGIRNDAARGGAVMDTGARWSVVAADYLGVTSPPWLNFSREWGPKLDTDVGAEIRKAGKLLSAALRIKLEDVVNRLPAEVLEEEGPTGPKMKRNWDGDED